VTTAAAWLVALAAWAGALVGLPDREAWWSPATWSPLSGAGLVVFGVLVALMASRLRDRDGVVDGTGRSARPARSLRVAHGTRVLAPAVSERAELRGGNVARSVVERRLRRTRRHKRSDTR
jgi:hypothetical protein